MFILNPNKCCSPLFDFKEFCKKKYIYNSNETEVDDFCERYIPSLFIN